VQNIMVHRDQYSVSKNRTKTQARLTRYSNTQLHIIPKVLGRSESCVPPSQAKEDKKCFADVHKYIGCGEEPGLVKYGTILRKISADNK
jgi:hypothetical protein